MQKEFMHTNVSVPQMESMPAFPLHRLQLASSGVVCV